MDSSACHEENHGFIRLKKKPDLLGFDQPKHKAQTTAGPRTLDVTHHATAQDAEGGFGRQRCPRDDQASERKTWPCAQLTMLLVLPYALWDS